MNNQKNNKSEKKKMTPRQAVAIIGILLLIALYIVTLIAAFADSSSSGKLFALCLFATIAVPILIWIYTWMYGRLTNRRTFADFELNQPERPDDSGADT